MEKVKMFFSKKTPFIVLFFISIMSTGSFGLQTAYALPIEYTSETSFLSAAGSLSMESLEGVVATNTFTFGASVIVPDFKIELSVGGGPAGGGVRNSSWGNAHATDGVNYFANSTGGGGQ